MLQKRPQRHMLGIEVKALAFGLVCRDEHHAGGVGPSQQDLEAVPVAQFSDPVQIGDQPLGVVLLRAGEERQQGLPGMLLLAVHRRKIEPPDPLAMAAQQLTHQGQVDGLDEGRIDEFLEVLRHGFPRSVYSDGGCSYYVPSPLSSGTASCPLRHFAETASR